MFLDEPKPKLEVSFNEEEKNELIITSQPHYIFSPRTQENIKFGEAYYLRVKVTNKGNEIAKQCRGYLKNIRKREDQRGEFTKLEKCEGSMRLLWAYERKENYRSTNFEQIPSGASEYLDVLVSYHPALKPKHLDRDKNTWFLKLKTQPQPLKYSEILEIKFDSQVEYELTIEVYADRCDPAKISLYLTHHQKSDTICVSSKHNAKNLESIYIPLCKSDSDSPPKIPDNYTAKELYDLL